ncbi:MAG TPA: 7TM domain-containing protein [Candidatus Levybacteria bacterium]|nr:7TM domain-containing protein [Candidatus Levybacteria bacterium]
MLLPVALAITLVATGLAAGLILLVAIVFSSTLARVILRKIRIMQFAKMALTIFIVSVGILATLTLSAEAGILAVTQISIFPVLLLILLSQNIVELQIDRSIPDILMISAITIFLGVLGYFLLSYEPIRNFVIVYPEIMLLVVPVNIIIGRYFGLRFTEYFRFSPITHHGNQ